MPGLGAGGVFRSRASVEVGIIDNHSSPSMTSGSAPLIRADPSRLVVPTNKTPGPVGSV
jgi:hypothetical protein